MLPLFPSQPPLSITGTVYAAKPTPCVILSFYVCHFVCLWPCQFLFFFYFVLLAGFASVIKIYIPEKRISRKENVIRMAVGGLWGGGWRKGWQCASDTKISLTTASFASSFHYVLFDKKIYLKKKKSFMRAPDGCILIKYIFLVGW